MPIEDKLTHDERLRLECIAQAIASSRGIPSDEGIIHTASRFERFIRDGSEEAQ